MKESFAKNRVVAGYIYAIIGSMSYGLNPLFCLPLYDAGYPPVTVVFYRYLLAVTMLAVLMLVAHRPFSISSKALKMSAIMGIFFGLSSISLFVSFTLIDAGIASVILFVYPLFVALMSSVLFHERLTIVALVTIITSFFGISMLCQPGEGEFNIYGLLLAVFSGLTYAVYLIGVNRSVLKSLPVSTLTFYALLSGTIVVGIYGLLCGNIEIVSGADNILCVTGLSLFPTIVSVVLVTKAIHLIGSTSASIFGALEPITALCISLAVFGGSITTLNIIGIFIVLISVTVFVGSRK